MSKNSTSWKKGESGNPRGVTSAKRALIRDVALLAREHTREAFGTVVDLMRNAADEKVRLRAAEVVLERGWGKAPQTVTLEVAGKVRDMTLPQIRARIAELESETGHDDCEEEPAAEH